LTKKILYQMLCVGRDSTVWYHSVGCRMGFESR